MQRYIDLCKDELADAKPWHKQNEPCELAKPKEDRETERMIGELVRKGFLKKLQRDTETYYSTTAKGKIVVLAHRVTDGVLRFIFGHPYLTWIIAGIIAGTLIIHVENALSQ